MGLRGRLVVALVATSVATLGAAALVVLPLLEQRLETDRLAELRGFARTIRPELPAVAQEDLRPDSPSLLEIAERLERRTGARITIYDRNDRILADTAKGNVGPPVVHLAVARARAARSRSGVASGEEGGRAFAVAVARNDDDPLTLVIAKRLSDTRAAAHVVRAALLPALLAGLVVALALALLVTRSLLRRLKRLQADAEALGTEGLRHRVTVDGGDEVAVVATALEAMRGRLVDEEASRQAFVSTASHELRTPLASLQATLELLREEAESGRAADRAETALRQTHRLIGLATDLLDLSRVDGDVPLAPEPLELGEHARTIAPEFGARLAAEGRTLEVAGGPAIAVADPAAAARILRVLLDNACRYGAGAVTVTVEPMAQEVVLAVADEGLGLAGDEAELVFLRFTRGRAGERSPGAGLGLSIARGLARAMGGDLIAAGGPRFEVTLPAWNGERQEAPTAHSSGVKASG
jgi:signal transduction histidine kinase